MGKRREEVKDGEREGSCIKIYIWMSYLMVLLYPGGEHVECDLVRILKVLIVSKQSSDGYSSDPNIIVDVKNDPSITTLFLAPGEGWPILFTSSCVHCAALHSEPCTWKRVAARWAASIRSSHSAQSRRHSPRSMQAPPSPASTPYRTVNKQRNTIWILTAGKSFFLLLLYHIEHSVPCRNNRAWFGSLRNSKMLISYAHAFPKNGLEVRT